MTFKELSKNPGEYISLLFILLASLVLYVTFSFDHHTQRRVVYLTAGLYLAWSLYHHYRQGDLQVSIIIEYLIVALLGIAVLFATL